VNPAAQTQPAPAATRSQQVPSVPPPGLTPAYPAGPTRTPIPPLARPRTTASSDLAASGTRPTADTPPTSTANWSLTGDGTRQSGAAAGSADPRGYRQPAEARPESRRPAETAPLELPRLGDAPGVEMPRIDFSRNLDAAAESPAGDAGQPEGRVVPPWQSNDLPAEPPALRLVEPAPLTDPALSGERPQYREELSSDLRLEPRSLRLVDANGRPKTGDGGGLNGTTSGLNGTVGSGFNSTANGLNSTAGSGLTSTVGSGLTSTVGSGLTTPVGGALPRREPNSRQPSAEQAEPAAKDEIDDDLLIFAEARSAWFTDHFGEDDAQLDFASASDEGWRAAKHAAEPMIGKETTSGLPRRVPQQNLVPGSPVSAPERPLRVVRDPAAIAAHTSGYFRGWRRGQEVGGYRVGGRPGREASGGWDFSRDQEGDDEQGYEYRSARR
jgi:hypothetical protein